MERKGLQMEGKNFDHENLCTLPPLKFRRHSRSQEYTKKTFDFSSYYSDHFHYVYVTLHILDRPNLSFFISISLTCNRFTTELRVLLFLIFFFLLFSFVFFLHHSNISQFSCTFALYY